MKQRQVNLSCEQRQELLRTRDHDQRPYMRMKAAAILKVADGLSIRWVSANGLNRRISKDTLCDWISRYEAEGLCGLPVKAGRGRKPVFFPYA